MTEIQIPYGRHSIDQRDIDAVVDVLRGDWLTTGPAVERFEDTLSDVVGASVVAVSSGTAALHAAYAAAGVGSGDEVITTPVTFVATAAAALHLGATVKLADVEDETLNLDPAQVERVITSRTKVITAVDYAGHPAELDTLKDLAHGTGAVLVEDAAHSLGANYRDRPVGSIADTTTFSFHPVKLVTTGEGGALSTNDTTIVERARLFRSHGLVRNEASFFLPPAGPWHQEVHSLGLNYRIPDILAALGTSQLNKLSCFLERRRALAAHYATALEDIAQIRLPTVRPGIDPAWHLFPIRVPAQLRHALAEHLRAEGIGTQIHYLPLHLQPALSELGYKVGDFPIAERAYEELLSIPLYPALGDSEQEAVITAIRHFFKAP